jgi:hypothetical protein
MFLFLEQQSRLHPMNEFWNRKVTGAESINSSPINFPGWAAVRNACGLFHVGRSKRTLSAK